MSLGQVLYEHGMSVLYSESTNCLVCGRTGAPTNNDPFKSDLHPKCQRAIHESEKDMVKLIEQLFAKHGRFTKEKLSFDAHSEAIAAVMKTCPDKTLKSYSERDLKNKFNEIGIPTVKGYAKGLEEVKTRLLNRSRVMRSRL